MRLLILELLAPLDTETIFNSVKKTGKVIVIHEDSLTGGFGGEIAARISEECFENLDGPVKRFAAADTPIAFHPKLERQILPTRIRIYDELKKLLDY